MDTVVPLLRSRRGQRVHYAEEATSYDTTETCVVSHSHQRMLQADLTGILEVLARRGVTNVRALDACGGSGTLCRNCWLPARRSRCAMCAPAPVTSSRRSVYERASPTSASMSGRSASSWRAARRRSTSSSFRPRSTTSRTTPPLSPWPLSGSVVHGLLYTVFDPVIRPLPIWSLEYLDFARVQGPPSAGGPDPRARSASSAGGSAPTASSQKPGLLAEYHVETRHRRLGPPEEP